VGTNQNCSALPKQSSLLEKLSETGTLFIRDIQHAAPSMQAHLADFIQTGSFKPLKCEQTVQSKAYVICSGPRNLHHLVHEGSVSKELYLALRDATLSMPPLNELADDEFLQLVDDICEQLIRRQELKGLLTLSERAHNKLLNERPASLMSLRTRVRQLLVERSKKSEIYDEAQFDPACSIDDPELIEAARLGRHALKDTKMMARLWNKFKNQNKIATLLGVNRSSVSRRMREYRL